MRSVELASLIAAEFDEPWYRTDLASIVGDKTDEALATWVDSLCLANLGHRIADARFVNKSVGAVFGLTLADGSHVVLKLFPDIFGETELRAIERALALVVSVGFPAPRQLVPLTLADGVWGAFYELVPGNVLDAHVSDVRQTLAKLLAEFTSVAVQIDPSSLPVTPTRRDALWGTPHRVGIDLTIPGGEWIDARAREAQRLIRATQLPLIAAHMDWGAKNALFFDEHRVSAILDWDSLMAASEAEMVGRAAAQFTAQWPSIGSLTPSRDEASAFVREYEIARGRRFDAIEQRVINASADYLLAQVGRHGHSGAECADDDFRRLLRETAFRPLVSFAG
jgi:Phosphotransferase enzyme family